MNKEPQKRAVSFYEQFPHSVTEVLVEGLLLENSQWLNTFYEESREVEYFEDYRSLRECKSAYIKLIGILEYNAVEFGVAENQLSLLVRYYMEEIENAKTSAELRQLGKDFYLHLRSLTLQSRKDRPKQDRLHDCMSFIECSTNKKYTIQEMADVLGYNRTYLCNMFREKTGKSIKEYQLECKMKEAQTLLAYTVLPIRDISERLCFSSQSHFQRVFKSYTDETPAAWRKKHAKL